MYTCKLHAKSGDSLRVSFPREPGTGSLGQFTGERWAAPWREGSRCLGGQRAQGWKDGSPCFPAPAPGDGSDQPDSCLHPWPVAWVDESQPPSRVSHPASDPRRGLTRLRSSEGGLRQPVWGPPCRFLRQRGACCTQEAGPACAEVSDPACIFGHSVGCEAFIVHLGLSCGPLTKGNCLEGRAQLGWQLPTLLSSEEPNERPRLHCPLLVPALLPRASGAWRHEGAGFVIGKSFHVGPSRPCLSWVMPTCYTPGLSMRPLRATAHTTVVISRNLSTRCCVSGSFRSDMHTAPSLFKRQEHFKIQASNTRFKPNSSRAMYAEKRA